ncbi:unnamed protein product [Rotaria sp. Silwood1]|nr:unnamed protein product [Rotaria sp. Silwood1]
MIPTSTLSTLVLYFQRDSSITMDMLTEYLTCIPVLKHLEIKAHSKLLDANAWKMLLETSLPLLTHFTLQTTTFRIEEVDLQDVLISFQSSYWISKKNFNIIVTKHEYSDFDGFGIDKMKHIVRCEFDWPVIQCWIAPKRTGNNNNLMIVNKEINLRIDDMNSFVSCHYYFDNVKCLIVDNMDSSLLKWVKTHVNCSRIRQLAIIRSQENTDALAALLASLTNMSLLYITFDVLFENMYAFMRKSNYVKHLDISLSEHLFNGEDIIIIGKCFPSIEHLKINTSNLHNVSLLKKYLIHLRSLSVVISINRRGFFENYDRKKWKYDQRRQIKFLFQVTDDTMTVWLDQAAFEEPFWETFVVKPSESTAWSVLTLTSNSSPIDDTSDNQKKKSKFSFLNLFK